MIPNILHYIWVGPHPLPKQHRAYIEGWRQLHSGSIILEWNNDNLDWSDEPLRVARHFGWWTRIADIVRLSVLERYGGIYLDTDVELLKPLSPLRRERCFFGFSRPERVSFWVNNAVCGCEPGHWFIRAVLRKTIEQDPYRGQGPEFGPGIITDSLEALSPLVHHPAGQRISDVFIAPSHYFYPHGWDELPDRGALSADTYAIHHWAFSWRVERQLRAVRLRQLVRSAAGDRHFAGRAAALARAAFRNLRRQRNWFRYHLSRKGPHTLRRSNR